MLQFHRSGFWSYSAWGKNYLENRLLLRAHHLVFVFSSRCLECNLSMRFLIAAGPRVTRMLETFVAGELILLNCTLCLECETVTRNSCHNKFGLRAWVIRIRTRRSSCATRCCSECLLKPKHEARGSKPPRSVRARRNRSFLAEVALHVARTE
jgi:hypothetical protein